MNSKRNIVCEHPSLERERERAGAMLSTSWLIRCSTVTSHLQQIMKKRVVGSR